MAKLEQFARGIGWGAVSTLSVVAFQIVFAAVMARLLEPTDFGLVALAGVSLKFLGFFSQMGLVPALVQKERLDDDDIAVAFTLALIVSSAFTLLAQLLAPHIAGFLGMPRLTAVLGALSLSFLITGISAVSQGLIRRRLRFKRLAAIESVAYFMGYGLVGIPSALFGLGLWSLVAASLTQAASNSLLAYLTIRHPLRLCFNRQSIAHFTSFGSRFSLTGLFDFLAFNVDTIAVGKSFGDAAAGLYSRAMLLAVLPVQQPTYVFSRTLFPLLSEAGSNREKHLDMVQLSVLVVGAYASAVGVGIAVSAGDIVQVLLGSRWADSVPILQVLALGVAPMFVSHVIGVAFESTGALKAKLRVQAVSFMFLVPLLYSATAYGVVTVAVVMVMVEWLRLLGYVLTLPSIIDVKRREWLLLTSIVSLFALVSGAMVSSITAVVPPSTHPGIRLMIEILVGAASILVCLLLARRHLIQLPSVARISRRLPVISRMLLQQT